MTNLLFDYDGTLNNSLKIYAPAFRMAYSWLVENGHAEPREYTDKEIGYWLGFNSTQMWPMFQPELSTEIHEICRSIIGNEMNKQTQSGNAELYKGVAETLSALKGKGYTLIFLSNCRKRYQLNHTEIFGLDQYFDYFYCAEEFDFIPKYEIFSKIKSNHCGDYIMIGDRFHDMEVGSHNGIKSIGCAYGYGSPEELSTADAIVNDITEIPSVVEKLIYL